MVSFTYLIILVITYATNQISEIFIKHTFEIAFNFFQSHCDDECSQKNNRWWKQQQQRPKSRPTDRSNRKHNLFGKLKKQTTKLVSFYFPLLGVCIIFYGNFFLFVFFRRVVQEQQLKYHQPATATTRQQMVWQSEPPTTKKCKENTQLWWCRQIFAIFFMNWFFSSSALDWMHYQHLHFFIWYLYALKTNRY